MKRPLEKKTDDKKKSSKTNKIHKIIAYKIVTWDKQLLSSLFLVKWYLLELVLDFHS